MRQRGSIPLGVLITLVVILLAIAGLFVACDALFDDDDEPGDLGAPALVLERHRDSGDRDHGRDSRGDCEASDNCQDNDFSPDLEDSPVIVCLPSSTCNFGEGETAAMIRLDPVALVKTIQDGATAIGTAAGTMAGAIAAFPIGILL